MPDETAPKLTLMQETSTVGKRRVVAGRVRVRTETDVIEQIASGDLERDEVVITRVPLNVVVDVAPPDRTEGEVTIVSIVEERLVVEKRLILVEEIHLRRIVTRETVEIPTTVRRQRAVIERIDPETGAVLADTVSNEED